MIIDSRSKLKKYNPTLHQIDQFIRDAKKLGYGEIEIVVKTHDYISKIVVLKAVKPSKKTFAKSVTKRIMVKKKGKEENGKLENK